ncbi:histidinol dehydrogenase [Mesonia ostreae]|uniref:Histidinol dehydrogenase n=1 Tax=Mesonia ostreae TaxID=861110 RepID=A0ABU2KK28_9FLAO|nr:histidinol dehydrogenase [Mesonia ostreae]MDT0295013.1 histidinol dehydrogenase [Mesonia ostreae]
MHIIKNPSSEKWSDLLKRPTQSLENIESKVNEIFKEVSSKGEQALLKYTQQFDGISLPNLNVSPQEIGEAKNLVPEELQQAIQQAKENITKFHAAQKTGKINVETQKGVQCWQEKRPIQKVGLYIPGGSAPLFSTILMLAIPANLAGCQEIVLCSPPNKEGKLDPAILYTANLCGVTKIFKVGGIQAIAGMTFGTESIPKVYKIFGPGNQFVTVAKQLATKYDVAIDMPAGPSELLVFADETAKTNFVASDLLSQAEHGADSQVILVSTSEKMLQEVKEEVKKQLESLPRKQIATKAIQNFKLILMNTEKSALALINEYAPEHFIVVSKNEDFFIDGIKNAGSVFIGNYTPESAGDYASGTNHTLPTNGFAKQYSGVNLDSFLKSMTFQKIDATGIKNLGKTIELMAEAEGLHAHKNAVSLRLKSLE